MKVIKSTLPNGFRVLTIPIPSLESATLTVWARVGSRYETPRVNGLTHFLEHIVFKGGKRYPSAKAVSEAIDSIGGEFNASTGKELTNYYVKARVGYLETAFVVLSDMLLSPLLKEDDIKREKGVIKAEIDMYEDTPIRKIEDVYENLIYKGHPLGRDISGTKETVDSITKSDFVRYLNTYYYPENLLITVAGGVNKRDVLMLSQKYFGNLKSKRTKTRMNRFISKQIAPQLKLVYKKTDQAHFIIGFLGDKLDHKYRYEEAVLASILGGGMSSRLFIEVREKRGLAYAVRTSADHYTDTGRFTTYAGVTPDKAPDAIKIILKEYKKLSSINDCSISKTELRKAKEFLKGHFALSLEDTSTVNDFFGSEELLLGKTRSINEVYRRIDKVTVEGVVKIAQKFFRPKNLNLAIIGPYKNEEKFEKLLH